MKTYSGGEVVLISFPFTSSGGTKNRPALVLLDTGDDDILAARMTSQNRQGLHDIEIKDWKQAGLLQPSVVRLHKIATLEKRDVERRLGALSSSDWGVIKGEAAKLWCNL